MASPAISKHSANVATKQMATANLILLKQQDEQEQGRCGRQTLS